MKWKREYRIGIKDIDDQHRKIVDIINSYKRCLSNESINTYKKIGTVLVFLTNYTSYHFDAEESFLESINYPDLEKQKSMHKAFIKKLKDVLMKLKNKQSYTSIEFYYFLMDWLNNHILEEDMKIAEYVQPDEKQIDKLPTDFESYMNVEEVILPSLNNYQLMNKNNLIDKNELSIKRANFINEYYNKFEVGNCNELIDILQSLNQLKKEGHISDDEKRAASENILGRISTDILLKKIEDTSEVETIKNKLYELGVKL